MPILLDGRTATDHFPGIGRYVVSLARGLRAIAPDLDLALLQDPSAPATRLALPDLPTVPCPVSPFALRQQWAVPAALRRAGASLYHSAYYLMPYRPGVPTVLTYYDLIPLRYPQYYGRLQPLIYRVATALALRTARVTLCISEATRADLVRYFHADPHRLVVTPLAAGATMRPPSPVEIDRVRQKYALPDRYVLYLGINKPHKNLVRLAQAWGELTTGPGAPRPAAPLVIAGHWDARYPEARAEAERLGLGDGIRFAGPIADVDLPALYGGAALFVFPSLYEGFGLPVLEAMACGAPVVCANTSSLPEVGGAAALMVDPQDVTALAEAMRAVLTDEARRRAMIERGLAQAARFSWDETARLTLAAYQGAGA